MYGSYDPFGFRMIKRKHNNYEATFGAGLDQISAHGASGQVKTQTGTGDPEGIMLKCGDPEPCKLKMDIEFHIYVNVRGKTWSSWIPNARVGPKSRRWVIGHEKNHSDTWEKGFWPQAKKLHRFNNRKFDTAEQCQKCVAAIQREWNNLFSAALEHSNSFDSWPTEKGGIEEQAPPGMYSKHKFTGTIQLPDECN